MKVEVGQVWTRVTWAEQYTVVRVTSYETQDGIADLKGKTGQWTYMSIDRISLEPLYPEFWTFNVG